MDTVVYKLEQLPKAKKFPAQLFNCLAKLMVKIISIKSNFNFKPEEY